MASAQREDFEEDIATVKIQLRRYYMWDERFTRLAYKSDFSYITVRISKVVNCK
jgi:hypothetical protein